MIPISAPIVALVDVYDAWTSPRSMILHQQVMQMILNGECGASNPLVSVRRR
ncbi:MAG: hypothetical protein ACOX64_10035 [Candidatus Merdivicinus sp.]